jgi:hypothetical protein
MFTLWCWIMDKLCKHYDWDQFVGYEPCVAMDVLLVVGMTTITALVYLSMLLMGA